MRPELIAVAASALVGGLAGAGVTAWRAPSESRREPLPANEPARASAEGSAEARSAERLERLERAVSSLQARQRALESAELLPARSAPGGAGAPRAPRERSPSDDPVFEAAVLDVLERAEEERGSERDERRRERTRQRAEHWASTLAERLDLAPEQISQVAEIRLQLAADLREQRSAVPEGQFVPREERRAAAGALRLRAQRRLLDVLDARQAAAYEQLDDDLQLARPSDADEP